MGMELRKSTKNHVRI